jgi:hypothetical protein
MRGGARSWVTRAFALSVCLVSSTLHAGEGAPPAGTPPARDDPPAPLVTPPTRLVYAPGPYAASCPDVGAVKADVTHALGFDPFAEPATRIVLVTVSGHDTHVDAARVALLDDALTPLGERTLVGANSCAELMDAAALAMSIALDPTRALRPVAAPPPVPVPEPAHDDLEPPATTHGPKFEALRIDARPPVIDPYSRKGERRVRDNDPPWHGLDPFVRVDVHGGFGMNPAGFQTGLRLGVGVRNPWANGVVELRLDGPTVDTAVTTTSLSLHTVPCLTFDVTSTVQVAGCGVGFVGLNWLAGTNGGLAGLAGFGVRGSVDALAFGFARLGAYVEGGGTVGGLQIGGVTATAGPVFLDAGLFLDVPWG